ncbi:MAG TPA: DinB family protein [Candidatus Dormibacteraeota bacterium]|jgi:hypothetical protein
MAEENVSPDEAAGRIERAVEELMELVRSCGDAAWQATSVTEGWTVAALTHHVADGFALGEDWIERFRGGTDVPGTAATLDAANAEHANTYARVSREQVIELAQPNGAALAATIRHLGPQELSSGGAHGPADGIHLTVADVLGATDRHSRRHLASAREAIAGAN